MKIDQMIDVTDVPLRELVKAAYNPSRAQGLGAFHYMPGGLSDEEVDRIIDGGRESIPISIDYVKGRSCKFTVFGHEGRRYIRHYWYDHSDDQLRDLLRAVGIDTAKLDEAKKAHAEYEQACLDKAIAFLREQGGSFRDNLTDNQPDEDALTGLYVALERKAVTAEWVDRERIWKLVPDRAP